MNSLEIVTHCYSGDAVPIYHKLLKKQLEYAGAEYGKAGDVRVTITVWSSSIDARTQGVLAGIKPDGKFRLRSTMLPQTHLFRRAIGRNLSAIETEADVVWFTDCDYLISRDAVEAAYRECLNADANMVHPRVVSVNKTHLIGDRVIAEDRAIVPGDFSARRERRAIGGIQIVKGDWCREHGYLHGTDWVKPVSADAGFRSCKCDVPFRRLCGPSTGVDIPGVYRLRHSRAGRDGGSKDHGEKTRV